MQFDLRKYLYSGQKPYSNQFQADFSQADFPYYRVDKPVSAVFSASTDGQLIELELKVEGTLNGECARCLDPVEEPIAFERQWTLRQLDLEDPDVELPITDQAVIDLEELVYQELIMEAPFLMLCSDDCMGLCPVCGKKKVAGCTCQSAEDAAPVNGLSILKTLL